MNFRDLGVLADPVARGVALPRVPNSDGAGSAGDRAGESRSSCRVVRVAGSLFRSGPTGHAALQAMASALGRRRRVVGQVVLRGDGLVGIPAHLDFDEAATLPCAGADRLARAGAGRPPEGRRHGVAAGHRRDFRVRAAVRGRDGRG
ncbi:MAG: hypothetical protein R3E68_22080 [Burkholderiaceae bacterium]